MTTTISPLGGAMSRMLIRFSSASRWYLSCSSTWSWRIRQARPPATASWAPSTKRPRRETFSTIAAVEQELLQDGHVFRYRSADDFGEPENAFNICTFWYINALADCGRTGEARELFENMLASRNPSGLLSEDLDTKTGELWGNFPQTYSMVGIINAALRLSEPWEDAF